MIVGIVTLPLNNNYGGILQNFALQQVLIKLGHQPITLRYRFNLPFHRMMFYLFKRFLFGKKVSVLTRNKVMESFIDNNIISTNKINKYSPQLICKYNIDALIVGSDQVWRPKYVPYCLNDMYLAFARDSSVLRLSYAASFGGSEWEYTISQEKICSNYLKQFNAVSVREDSAVALCKEHFNIIASHVIDPTLLLTDNDYNCLKLLPSKDAVKRIACYILDITPRIKAMIEEYAKINNFEIQLFSSDMLDEKKTLSIEEWISVFKNSEMVITDSFHGTVFSIIYHKEFYTLINTKRGADRFYSLLDKLGLKNHIIDFSNFCLTPIVTDWRDVDNRIQEWRSSSLMFLKNVLNEA